MMKLAVVNVPSIKEPIQPSPGFAKKGLSGFKLDACGLCEFGCSYCSSNAGNYLRINRKRFARLTKEQLDRDVLPAEDPSLMFYWPDYLDRLEAQLGRVPPGWGTGQTLVFSMLTDGFSPLLVKEGITERTLRLVVERTGFRIRILTKNAIVGSRRWIDVFQRNRSRFVVGLSVGTLDNEWAKSVERYTSLPTARLRAVNNLQQAGIPTYGMLCPVFPDVLKGNALEELVDRAHPEVSEHVWAEPYNDRDNWEQVRRGYTTGSFGYEWLTRLYEKNNKELWSRYATELYVRLRDKARSEAWLHKLRYLLYEDRITASDAKEFQTLEGVWLQCKPGAAGKSTNPHIAQYQTDAA